MALIRSLPYDSYANFRSSLMLMTDIKFGTVKEAFMQEQRNCQPCASEHSMALKATSSSLFSSSSKPRCEFCTMEGHTAQQCFKLHDAKQQAKKEVEEKQERQKRSKGRGKGRNKANAAEEAAETPQKAEFAGNASLLLDHSSPKCLLNLPHDTTQALVSFIYPPNYTNQAGQWPDHLFSWNWSSSLPALCKWQTRPATGIPSSSPCS